MEATKGNMVDFLKFLNEINPTYFDERKTLKVIENLSKAIRETETIYELLKIRKSLDDIQNDLIVKEERFPTYYKLLIGKVEQLEKSINNQIQLVEKTIEASQQNSKPEKLKKTLFQFINYIEDKEAFLLELKNAFPTEIGKSIRAIIDLLENEDILIIGTREYKHFVKLLEEYFGRNIGDYNGIQNIKTIDKAISNPINKKLKPLIIKYKTT